MPYYLLLRLMDHAVIRAVFRTRVHTLAAAGASCRRRLLRRREKLVYEFFRGRRKSETRGWTQFRRNQSCNIAANS